ncbi:nucleoside/nucleotide kinase family protein [Micromonospora andamanensis]|uniref:AAA family ATPase n=1 Tax=Micromonospora andamanensis TaxID=1287068 RepID=UPI0019519D81|nr:AAA family ATPase [Micromonospora andamanensis]GIJ38327.1 hypothetical protein Vwe01_16520 [Micromonospora andamanensis]
MLIEVLGVDGAGKTTLIDAARRQLQQNGRMRAYERSIRSESRNLIEGLQLAVPEAGFSARDQELAVLLDAVREAHGSLHAYRGSPVSHVFVTGYRTALFARLRARGFDDDAGLRALVGHIPRADLGVLVDAPPAVALERIRRRQKGDQVLSFPDPLAEIERRAAAARWAARREDCLHLDGTRPVDALTSQLLGAISGPR